MTQEADVIVIGGGITGLGIARDATMRGFKVILVEQNELSSGTSGYFHGILHSGARYITTDPESALECLSENRILKNIAKDAILDTGGFFLAINDEDIIFAEKFLNACVTYNFPANEVIPSDVLKKEKTITNKLKCAFAVPDAFIDGSKMMELFKKDCEERGVKILTHQKVTKLLHKNNRIEAVKLQDKDSKEEKLIESNFVINAGGVWADQIAKLVGIAIMLTLDRGVMIILEGQPTRAVINRCHAPDDGDILVPTGTQYILGTTSGSTNNRENHTAEDHEIKKLIKEAKQMIPSIEDYPIVGSYAGVRPLFSLGTNPSISRDIKRTFKILNHTKEGIGNFISVVGGKFTIHRLMAERAVDEMCKTLGIKRECKTTQTSL